MSEESKKRDLTWRIKEVVLNDGTKEYYPQFQVKHEVFVSRFFRWWKWFYEFINQWSKETWHGLKMITDKRDGKKYMWYNFHYDWYGRENDSEGATTFVGAHEMIDKFDSDFEKLCAKNKKIKEAEQAKENLKKSQEDLKKVKVEIVHPLEEDEDCLIEKIN